jgi:hypothetical protein
MSTVNRPVFDFVFTDPMKKRDLSELSRYKLTAGDTHPIQVLMRNATNLLDTHAGCNLAPSACVDIYPIQRWLEDATAALASLLQADLSPLGEKWNNIANVSLIIKMAARQLARTPNPPRELAGDLNRLGNASPTVYRKGDYYYTFDFLFWQKEQLANYLLAEVKGHSLSFLHLGPSEGLLPCWLIDEVFPGSLENITCISGHDEVDTAEFLLQKNIHSCSQSNIAMTMPDRFRTIAQEGRSYDCILIDTSFRPRNLLPEAEFGWKFLKADGVLIIEGISSRRTAFESFIARRDSIDSLQPFWDRIARHSALTISHPIVSIRKRRTEVI